MSTARPSPSTTTPPYSLIWAPIPLITWFFPPIGHLGISDSRGVIHDFAGPYFINRGSTTGLGAPTRYVKLDPSKCEGKGWDEALAASDASYSAKMHNIVCQNCHHHVGDALAEMKYGGKTSFGMVGLGAKVFLTGQFTRGGAIVTFLPSVIIAAIAFFLIYAVGSAV